MYPFERYMKTFKEYVKNYAQPEACITECYLGMECVRYCDVHADKADEGEVNQSRNEDIQHDSTPAGRPLSKAVQVYIGSDMMKIAYRYVLFNTTAIDPYRIMHMDDLRSSHTDSKTNSFPYTQTHLQIGYGKRYVHHHLVICYMLYV